MGSLQLSILNNQAICHFVAVSSMLVLWCLYHVTGFSVWVQFYERLSPLVPMKVPLGSFSNIQTGDCIVTFSRCNIYRLKVSDY